MVIAAIEAESTTASTTGARRPRRAPARRRRWVFFFVLPSFLLLLLFFVLPFVLNIPFAFSDWTSYSNTIGFGGLDNFDLLLSGGELQSAILVTFVYAIIAMTIQNLVAIALALTLKDTNRGNSIFRSILFIPVLISPLAAGYVWRAIVAPQGPLNDAIGVIVPGFDFAWLGHPGFALVTVAFIDAWKWSGLATLVYIAGLNSIPVSLLEAAALDGAGPVKRFFRVQLPLLAPSFTFNIATTLIGALSAFDIIASTTSGGPGSSTTTLNVALQNEFKAGFLGSASSIGLTVSVLVVLLAVPLVGWLRRREVTG
ncbi:sugar ABC transporter permease [Schumannella luteola]|uniref:Multiple sugar transport system permease protein/raffinose/stachyose/melibiose transport system permease protein n=1 Tax=Schumannella luteola TaxID=472059 RepID=A0A852YMC0_9MICO|nr:sugar ABC transporter permease [Schumannella luteola]NYG98375.1 multiple sugar transport system permease protein/raffinose/stachyose/melibiose transport system permease protein [Schumannella luteola]TPX05792.1 sugar ABC transporter permease [Schumannella luteola]